MLIDAHHHLWKYNDTDYVWMTGAMTSLRRHFLIPELEATLHDCGVEGTVAVQARQSLEETDWLLDLASRNPLLLGVVGWVPLNNANVADHLDRYRGERKLRGVRHVLHDEADDFYMLREDFNRGIALLKDRGLAYDILIFERHLPQTITFVDRHPKQVFVVDHIAKPKIREGQMQPWKDRIGELAKRNNVYCKVSGMVTEADWTSWTADHLRPSFEVVLSAFGPERLMFGSDWPVLTLAGTYRRWVETFDSLVAELSPEEKNAISRDTARRAYGL